MRIAAIAVLTAVMLAACQDQPTAPSPSLAGAKLARLPQATHVVHVVYLVPADREARAGYTRGIRDGVDHLQLWMRDLLPGRLTFSTAAPTVRTLVTPHEASWYRENPAGSDPALWFWYNVLADAFALTGGGFFDPDEIWVFYVDADPACGQAVGAAAGVALLPANDLRGLAGAPTISTCTHQVEPDQGVCRWVGGLGHELGHAAGLPHPPGCETGDPNCASSSLMWFGYISYPQAILTAEEQATLGGNPFFVEMRSQRKLPACAGQRPQHASVALQSRVPLHRTTAAGLACAHGRLADALEVPLP
jgi:hypothetical protein